MDPSVAGDKKGEAHPKLAAEFEGPNLSTIGQSREGVGPELGDSGGPKLPFGVGARDQDYFSAPA